MTRTIRIQLAVFAVVALTAMAIVGLGYMRLPAMLFGVGHYTIKVQLPEAAGLYTSANVTYRGTEVGRVKDVHLSATGVEADLSMKSDIKIPSNLDAQVHSQTAIGEQYIALLPRNATSPPLKNGDVVTVDRTSVPPNISALLDAANRGVAAIPNDNLKTVIDESYTALAGLGPDFARLVKGSTALATDADTNRDAIAALIDDSAPVLDSQTDTANAIYGWAAHLANITNQLQTHNDSLVGVLDKGPPASDEVRALIDRVNPTLPIVLANLVSVGSVAVVYQNDIEQILVLVPQGVAAAGGAMVADKDVKTDYRGFYLDFNLNINVPHLCSTGFLPAQQRRNPTFEDAPDRPAGGVYCRIPQDSPNNVRGARNIPCETRPGKRAPTVKMCESNEEYTPLNNGDSWKGDPNATLSGQDIPQLPPGSPPPASAPPPVPAIASAEYDPATGTYLGPDGNTYTQTDLGANAPKEQTWQQMLMPPNGN